MKRRPDTYDAVDGVILPFEDYPCDPNNNNSDWAAAGLPEGGPKPNVSERDAGNV